MDCNLHWYLKYYNQVLLFKAYKLWVLLSNQTRSVKTFQLIIVFTMRVILVIIIGDVNMYTNLLSIVLFYQIDLWNICTFSRFNLILKKLGRVCFTSIDIYQYPWYEQSIVSETMDIEYIRGHYDRRKIVVNLGC